MEKTLHQLNMEQRLSAKLTREMNEEAGDAARDAVVSTLEGKRPDGKRTRKNLRGPADAGE